MWKRPSCWWFYFMSLKHDKVNARHRGPLLCARSFVYGTETMSQISRLHLYLGTTHHGDFAKSKGRQSNDSFVWQSTCVYSYSRTMMTHVDKSIAGRLIYTVDKFTMTGIAQRVFGAGEKFMSIWICIFYVYQQEAQDWRCWRQMRNFHASGYGCTGSLKCNVIWKHFITPDKLISTPQLASKTFSCLKWKKHLAQ